MSQGVMLSDLCPNYQLTADIQMAHKVAIHIFNADATIWQSFEENYNWRSDKSTSTSKTYFNHSVQLFL